VTSGAAKRCCKVLRTRSRINAITTHSHNDIASFTGISTKGISALLTRSRVCRGTPHRDNGVTSLRRDYYSARQILPRFRRRAKIRRGHSINSAGNKRHDDAYRTRRHKHRASSASSLVEYWRKGAAATTAISWQYLCGNRRLLARVISHRLPDAYYRRHSPLSRLYRKTHHAALCVKRRRYASKAPLPSRNARSGALVLHCALSRRAWRAISDSTPCCLLSQHNTWRRRHLRSTWKISRCAPA